MKMLRLYWLAGLSVFSFLPFFTAAQNIHFELVPKKPGELNSNIYCMTQDNQGYLWLGTLYGLFKYDGSQYTAYHIQLSGTGGLSSDQVEAVQADRQGNIWIGHYHSSTGLDVLDPQTGIFTHYSHKNGDPHSLTSDSVTAIGMDREGTIWVGTQRGLNRFDAANKRFDQFLHDENDPSSLSSNQVRIIYCDRQGGLWIGTGNPFFEENRSKKGGLNFFDEKTGKFKTWLHDDKDPHSLVDNRIRAIFEDSRGNFWVGSAGDGLHRMNRSTGSFERLTNDPAHPHGLSRPPVHGIYFTADDHITFITEDTRGRLWIGTHNGGINVYDPSTKISTWYGRGNESGEKLEDHSFWTAYRTRDGVLWLGSWYGYFYKVNPHDSKVPYTRLGRAVYGFAEDSAGKLWLSTSSGISDPDPNGNMHNVYLVMDSLSNRNSVFGITKDSHNRLWLQSALGLKYFDPASGRVLDFIPQNRGPMDLTSDTIVSISTGRNDILWIGTYGNGMGKLDLKTGTVVKYFNKPGDSTSLKSNSLQSITEDSEGNIWVGSSGGLQKLDANTGIFRDYITNNVAICVFEDREKNLWAGTSSGLFRYDRANDAFVHFADKSGVIRANWTIYSIKEDDPGFLWLNTIRGVVKMDKSTAEAVLIGNVQGYSPFFGTNAVFIRKNGDVLFGDTAGYYTYASRRIQQDSSKPVVNINSFVLNDQPVLASPGGILEEPVNRAREIRLRHNQNTFSFNFSTVDFISDHNDMRVSYMLQNYDNNWRQADENRDAFYFNLPPGEYVFRVRAYGANGRSDEKDISIIISPPWWRTWWAYSLYGIFLVTGIWFTDRFRKKIVVEKERAKTRDRELAQAKEIEKAYSELKNTQAQLIQSEKMASLGELTAGIAHEIQNPLNFVNNFSEVNTELIDEADAAIDAGKLQDAKELLGSLKSNQVKINQHGKRADGIVKGMLQHSRISGTAKELADLNDLADEYFRLAYHGLRAQDNGFNATMKTNFDPSVGKINMVPQEIGRVLLNLYNNAFYAVAEKKKHQLPDYEPTVTVETKKLNGSVEILVKDNGNGIPQKLVDKIFQPFFTTKPTGRGTGLGLSLSYDIVRTHGGEIKVHSNEGEGTEFVVVLPS